MPWYSPRPAWRTTLTPGRQTFATDSPSRSATHWSASASVAELDLARPSLGPPDAHGAVYASDARVGQHGEQLVEQMGVGVDAAEGAGLAAGRVDEPAAGLPGQSHRRSVIPGEAALVGDDRIAVDPPPARGRGSRS